ncbi:hypothetical protein ATO8_05816 [Roseivivax marinus]|uniref:Uncharacterized protein n=1 Tax=Roseivivax marinus TaxID=1379903 RepID=W4HL96_9RHOB|nr:hypothetical protein [Roseivivax marinus]ETW13522.1 hypothetical protein ATO8_05816 [Roseivivax marinus]
MIVVIGFIIAFALMFFFGNRATRACRWREYRASDTESTWTCVQCGAKTTGLPRKSPEMCLRDNA